jgi:hypothetical protein
MKVNGKTFPDDFQWDISAMRVRLDGPGPVRCNHPGCTYEARLFRPTSSFPHIGYCVPHSSPLRDAVTLEALMDMRSVRAVLGS